MKHDWKGITNNPKVYISRYPILNLDQTAMASGLRSEAILFGGEGAQERIFRGGGAGVRMMMMMMQIGFTPSSATKFSIYKPYQFC